MEPLSDRLGVPSGELPGLPPGAPPQVVFFIDEHPDCLRTMQVALAGEPYRLESALNAVAALDRLATLRPALILIEAAMTDRDGTCLARRLFASARLTAVPVVAMV